MRRVYAFCYAVGDARLHGEIKIGETGAETHAAAIANVRSRYKMVYRHLVVFKVIPVAIPKRDAEDIIKTKLAACHHGGELYDLPSASTDDTRRHLDLVFGELEVPFEAAHHVDKPYPENRRKELQQQRRDVELREEERLMRKRRRVEERAAADLAAAELKEAARRAEKEEADRRAEERRRVKAQGKKVEATYDDVARWAREHIVVESNGVILLADAFVQFQQQCDIPIGKKGFNERLCEGFRRYYTARKKVGAKTRSCVFTGLRLI